MRSSRAFTLIELLVVVAIISLFVAVVFSNLSSARMKARDARRFFELGQVRQELLIYFNSNGSYPALPVACGAALWAQSNVPACWNAFGTLFSATMPQFPIDPVNTTIDSVPYIYAYQPVSGGTGFRLVSVLQTSTSPGDLCAAGGDGPVGFPASFYCIGDNWQ